MLSDDAWWRKYWGMPKEVVTDKPLEAYCRYCTWQGTVEVKTIHTVLCPKCDMPVDFKAEVRVKDGECGALHPEKTGIYCQRAKGHDGMHTDFQRLYSWPNSVVEAKVTTRIITHQRVVRCGQETADGPCARPVGHPGICWSSAVMLDDRGHYQLKDERSPVIRNVEKAGKGMITATLKDGSVVAVEFQHEYKTIRGRRKVNPQNNVAYRVKSKVLSGTVAKLYRLEERTDEDKPGVTQLVKALLNTACVTPHVNDLHKGLAGGRRAALQRVLCDHDVELNEGRCQKCHITHDAVSPLAAPPMSREDRKAVWDAYWHATASVKTLECGCVTRATVPGRFFLTPCDMHKAKKEAA